MKSGKELIAKLEDIITNINEDQARGFLNKIHEADRIFIVGMGRSGLAGKAFAMRLMHCGKNIFVVGETITPAIKDGDVLIAITGSGKTSTVVSICETAIKYRATLLLITSNNYSELSRMADQLVLIKGRTTFDTEQHSYDERQIEGKYVEKAPMGTLFELSTMIFLDSIIAELMKEEHIGELLMKKKHANLE